MIRQMPATNAPIMKYFIFRAKLYYFCHVFTKRLFNYPDKRESLKYNITNLTSLNNHKFMTICHTSHQQCSNSIFHDLFSLIYLQKLDFELKTMCGITNTRTIPGIFNPLLLSNYIVYITINLRRPYSFAINIRFFTLDISLERKGNYSIVSITKKMYLLHIRLISFFKKLIQAFSSFLTTRMIIALSIHTIF